MAEDQSRSPLYASAESFDGVAGAALGDEVPQVPLQFHTAVATLMQNTLGAGVLALPFAFRSAGVVGGMVLLVLVHVLSVLSMGVLVELSNELGTLTYKAAAERTMGNRWPTLIESCVLCYNLGVLTSYCVLLGDFLHSLGVVATDRFPRKNFCSIILVSVVCWPLGCAPSLGGIRWMSLLGLAGVCFTVVAVIKRHVDNSYDCADKNNLAVLNIDTLGACFPILVGAFGAHYNIPILYSEVAPDAKGDRFGESIAGRNASRRMMKIIFTALSLSALIYGTVGVVVYATFGSATESDFSGNFDSHDIWLIVVRLMMSLAICASFPLTMISATRSLYNLTFQQRGVEFTARIRVPLATSLTLLCLLVGVAASDVGVVLSYNGSVFGIASCFIFPMLMYLHLPRHRQEAAWRHFSIISVALGVAFGILGVSIVAYGMTHHK